MKSLMTPGRSLAAAALATIAVAAPAVAQSAVQVPPVPTPGQVPPIPNPTQVPPGPGSTLFDPRVSGFDPRFSQFDPRTNTFFNPNIGPGVDPFFTTGAFNDPFVRGARAVTGNPFITQGLFNPGFFGGFGGWPGFGWSPAGASAMGIGPLGPGAFGPMGGMPLMVGFRPNPPPPPANRRQRVRNVRIIEDGPGAATASAPLGTPGSPPGNSAVGAAETRAATAVVGVPSERTVVAGALPRGRDQRTRNVRVIQDGPGAATASAPLGTPGSPPGNSAIGAAETRAATALVGVPSERTVVAAPDYRIARRLEGLMRTRAMLPARVVSVGATGVRVRLSTSGGKNLVRRYSLPNVFFYRGDRLYDADSSAGMLKRNDVVLVPDGLGDPL